MKVFRSGPLPKKCHDCGPQKQTHEHKRDPLPIPRPVRVKQEVSRQQLNQPRVKQDARRDRVQHARHDLRREAARVVPRGEADSDGHRDGRREAVGGA